MGIVYGGSGYDTLTGTPQINDTFYGYGGNDTIFAEAGNDVLFGGTGVDTLFAGAGNDLLYGGQARDNYFGGGGNDTLFVESSTYASSSVFQGGSGVDTLDITLTLGHLDLRTTTIRGIEAITIHHDTSDTTLRTVTLLSSQVGNGGIGQNARINFDNIGGGDPNSRLFVQADQSVVDLSGWRVTGADPDRTQIDIGTGFSGSYTLIGTGVSDTFFIRPDTNATAYGGGGNDTFFGAAGPDVFYGGAGDDVHYGGAGLDRLFGGAGNDELVGGDNFDRIFGGDGDDFIRGDGGPDRVFGGAGNDFIVLDYVGGLTDPDTTVAGGSGEDRLLMITDGSNTTFNLRNVDFSGFERISVESYAPADNDTDTLLMLASQFGPGLTRDGVLDLRDADEDMVVAIRMSDRRTLDLSDLTVLTTGTGQYVEIIGDRSTETITGTAGSDLIRTNRGDDVVYGGDGDDGIIANGGNNRFYGGNGRDQIVGGADNDLLVGGGGGDAILVERGSNTLFGNGGNDSLTGGTGADRIFGGSGNDFMLGENFGSVAGTGGNDTLFGGTGDDTMWGGGGRDSLFGGDGNDAVAVQFGDVGAGEIYDGGSGTNDVFAVGLGDGATVDLRNTTVTRFEEFRLIAPFAADAEGRLVIAASQAQDNLQPGHRLLFVSNDGNQDLRLAIRMGGETVLNLANVDASINGPGDAGITIFGDSDAERIFGSTLNDIIIGGGGGDTLQGRQGEDALYGGGGNDILRGGTDSDLIYGGADDDLIYGGTGSGFDTLYGDAGNDTFFFTDLPLNAAIDGGTGSADTLDFSGIAGTAGIQVRFTGNTATYRSLDPAYDANEFDAFSIERVVGSEQNDDVRIGQSGTTVFGRAGEDDINGGLGNDVIFGGAGNDDIEGFGGLDRLYGGAGDDQITADIRTTGSTDLTDLQFDPAFVVNGGSGFDTVEIRVLNSDSSFEMDLRGLTFTNVEVLVLADPGPGYFANTIMNAAQFSTGALAGVQIQPPRFLDITSQLDIRMGAETQLDLSDIIDLRVERPFTVRVVGDAANEAIIGSFANEAFYGNRGDDTLNGGSGEDLLVGGFGDDVIRGGAGNDTIHGGLGQDLLIGGGSADVFQFTSAAQSGPGAAQRDTISNFALIDTIDVSALGFTAIGTGPLRAGRDDYLRVLTQGGDTRLLGDTDGDGVAEFEVLITNYTLTDYNQIWLSII